MGIVLKRSALFINLQPDTKLIKKCHVAFENYPSVVEYWRALFINASPISIVVPSSIVKLAVLNGKWLGFGMPPEIMITEGFFSAKLPVVNIRKKSPIGDCTLQGIENALLQVVQLFLINYSQMSK